MAKQLSEVFDKYTLRARIYPAFLVTSPILILAIYLTNEYKQPLHFVTSTFILSAFIFLLSQFGRDKGKKKEAKLYKYWGGKPTTLILRHSDKHLDVYTKRRYHEFLAKHLTDITFPTQEQEANNQIEADEVYESCTRFLISKTRDTSVFDLLFSENISFGFRRNLWGMKYIGIGIVFLCLFVLLTINCLKNDCKSLNLDQNEITITVILSLFLIIWVFMLNKSWVRIAAYAYAERLLEASNKIEMPKN